MANKRVKVKARMKELGYDVNDLAAAVGMSVAWGYKLLAGTRNPSIEQAKKVADWLGSTIEQLFCGETLDEMSQEQAAVRESA